MWPVFAILMVSAAPPAAWPPGVPDNGLVKEIAVYAPPGPVRVDSVRIRFASAAGRVKIHFWRDIGSRVRPYLPYRHFEFDVRGPVDVDSSTPDADGMVTVNTLGLELRNGERLFIGIFTTRSGPRFATRSRPGSPDYIELPIADDATEPPTLLEVPGGFEVDVQSAPVTPDTPRLFEDVTERVGLDAVRARTVAWADVDGDEDDDLIADGSRLYINDAGRRFTRDREGWPGGGDDATLAVFADVDGDGDLDAFTGDRSARRPARILINDGTGRFSVSSATPVLRSPTFAASWSDVDGDGDADVFIANGWDFVRGNPDAPDALWINEGGGRFRDQSRTVDGDGPLFSRVAVTADWFGFGEGQTFVGTFRQQPDRLFLSGSDPWVNVAPKLGMTDVLSPVGTRVNGHALGADTSDLDGDGQLDLVVSNLVHPDWRGFAHSAPSAWLRPTEVPHAPVFVPLSAYGIPFDETPTNIVIADFNADGQNDLLWNSMYHAARLILQRDGRFVDRTLESGLDIQEGEGLAYADFDQDGRIDVAIEDKARGLRLLRNVGPRRPWVAVRVIAPGGAPPPAGATVTFKSGPNEFTRWISGGSGQGQQNSVAVIAFPSAKARSVQVTVRPLRAPAQVFRVSAGQTTTIELAPAPVLR